MHMCAHGLGWEHGAESAAPPPGLWEERTPGPAEGQEEGAGWGSGVSGSGRPHCSARATPQAAVGRQPAWEPQAHAQLRGMGCVIACELPFIRGWSLFPPPPSPPPEGFLRRLSGCLPVSAKQQHFLCVISACRPQRWTWRWRDRQVTGIRADQKG